MLEINKVSGDYEFLMLEKEWNSLLERSNANTIFLTWEWLYNWWKVYKQDKDLWILLVRENGRLVGIAPFFLSEVKYLDFLNIPQMQFLGSEEVGSDYLDFIIESGSEQIVTEAILNFLKSKNDVWDAIKITDFPSDSKNLRYLRDYNLTNGYYSDIQSHTTCPYIPLSERWDVLLNSLSKNMKYNVKRRRHRLEQDYKAEFVVLKDRDKLNDAFDDLIRLNQIRAKFRGNNGVFYSERFTEFHRNIIPIFFDKDFLRMCFIKINGIAISTLYIFKYNHKYFYYQSGLDQAWDKFSPGMVLFSYCIENAISEGMREFDFLRGEEDYKYKWTKEHKKNLEIKIFRDSIRGGIVFWTQKIMIKGKEMTKKILKHNFLYSQKEDNFNGKYYRAK